MANTLTISISANYSGNAASTTNSVNNYAANVTDNTAPQGVQSFTVPTSDTAIPLAGISAPRYLYIQNLDATNYITVKTAVGGTAIARLLPGASGGDAILIPLDPSITAPSWLSHTATCLVNYRVYGT